MILERRTRAHRVQVMPGVLGDLHQAGRKTPIDRDQPEHGEVPNSALGHNL